MKEYDFYLVNHGDNPSDQVRGFFESPLDAYHAFVGAFHRHYNYDFREQVIISKWLDENGEKVELYQIQENETCQYVAVTVQEVEP